MDNDEGGGRCVRRKVNPNKDGGSATPRSIPQSLCIESSVSQELWDVLAPCSEALGNPRALVHM